MSLKVCESIQNIFCILQKYIFMIDFVIGVYSRTNVVSGMSRTLHSSMDPTPWDPCRCYDISYFHSYEIKTISNFSMKNCLEDHKGSNLVFNQSFFKNQEISPKPRVVLHVDHVVQLSSHLYLKVGKM